MRKTILQEQYSCSLQKTARKNTKYSRYNNILKIGHLAKAIAHAKAIDFAKWSVWVKNLKYQKNAKKNSTTTAQLFCAENGSKNTKYLKNNNILKIAHLAKPIAHARAIGFAEWSVWVKTLKCQKHAKKNSTTTAQLFCAKNGSKKPNIQEMTIFQKSAILQRLYIAHATAIAFAKWSVWVKK